MNPIISFFKYAIIFLLLGILVPIMLLMGIENSSGFFSWLAMKIGPKLKRHKVVLRNLELCFPDMDPFKRRTLAIKTWGNLGAIFGEMLFWKLMKEKEFKKRVEIIDDVGAFKAGERIITTPHISNFEIFTHISKVFKFNIHCLYSASKKKYIDKIILWLRKQPNLYFYKNSGNEGLKQYIISLKKRETAWMLVDRYPSKSEGIDTTFFSIPTKTSGLPARLALKYECPIYFAHIIRTKAAHYTIKSQQLEINQDDTPQIIMQRINDLIEEQIKKYPEQWYWILHRFDKSLY